MVLTGCGVYRDTDHINNPIDAYFCDVGLFERNMSRYDAK